ncbi:hypothetical protein GBA52_028809 [Prunus armeniaca]|nr:hypothetical protein GBA52_028809 [Prunus armeniaca]
MSETALRDLNAIPGSEKKNESSSKGSITKPLAGNANENQEECQKKATAALGALSINGAEVANTGVEVGIAEVEYIESENLNDLEDVDTSLKTLVTGLESKDWVLLCEALNNGDVISLVVRSLKNPRSAVCKTAIMTSADIFNAYNDLVVDSLDPLIHLAPSTPGVEGIKAYGIDKFIQTAASQLSDQLPESREAARILLLELQTVYEKFNDLTPASVSEHPEPSSWENFCQSKLSPLSAQAVLRLPISLGKVSLWAPDTGLY